MSGVRQSFNESFHNTLWKLSPKNCYNSVLETQFLLHLATLILDQGYEARFSNLFQISGISVSSNMLTQWQKEDKIRKYNKILLLSSEKLIGISRELKWKRTKTNEALIHKGGPIYKSGNFHSSDDTQKEKSKWFSGKVMTTFLLYKCNY